MKEEVGCDKHKYQPVFCKIVHNDATDMKEFVTSGRAAFGKAHVLIHVKPEIGAVQGAVDMVKSTVKSTIPVKCVVEREGVRAIFQT